ncbi:alpha/beta hydrolase [Gordonia sp. TBRC 11910]|uniref:Alpha/beta hydrolase n=1 Tax=Gordonia asplenii TaxID=2725283 RepID=A0A848L2B2_9ACTN|nr:alpha/beta hydrolase [Gordonia asplenii]NMO03225.1 alpha/beta hydrolase [Gordonia asplenii]
MPTFLESLSDVTVSALQPVSPLLVRLWAYPAFSVPLALGVDAGIRTQRCGGRLLGARTHQQAGPQVAWHEGGSGPAVLLLNGFTADGDTWPQAWVTELERTHRVIRVDNRGTGESGSSPRPYRLADMADDAYDVVRACGEESVVVFGLSMGGMIAQELAVRHPEVVKRLVLAASIPPVPAWVASEYGVGLAAKITMGRRRRDPAAEPAAEVGRALMAFAAPGFTVSEDELRRLGTQVLSNPTTPVAAISQARAINGWWNPSRLASITAPTTVVHGLADRVVPIANARRLAQYIPDVELVEVAGCGHMVPWEAPEVLLHAIAGEA